MYLCLYKMKLQKRQRQSSQLLNFQTFYIEVLQNIELVMWLCENFLQPIQEPDSESGFLMPGPCSHFYFDINFGNRLYSKEERPGSPLLSKSDYMDRA